MAMDREKLSEILENHRRWLDGDGDGERAYLRGANLRGANLRGANLSHAVLADAYLSDADLRDAVLADADLRGAALRDAVLADADLRYAVLHDADLTRADLRDADLRGADLHGADLRYADLRDANLSHANLNGANLSHANLADADLSGTCLDPALIALQRSFAKECPPLHTGGRIVWRTATSQHVGKTKYLCGKTYVAPIFSFSVETDCHPGIYAGSLKWMKENYPNEPLVRCYVRDGDWVISAKGAIRSKRLRVLSQ